MRKTTRDTAENLQSFSAENPMNAARTLRNGVNIRTMRPADAIDDESAENDNNRENTSPNEGCPVEVWGAGWATVRISPKIIRVALVHTPLRSAQLVHRSTKCWFDCTESKFTLTLLRK